MPASTNLLSSASPIHDGTHSSSRWASALAFLGLVFFGFAAPFFGAISQIWLGFGGGSKCKCESRYVTAEEEDEMVKGQRYESGVRRRSYKALPPLFRIRGFLGNRSRDLRFSEFSATARWAVTWAFA